jgi:hypothetical protein
MAFDADAFRAAREPWRLTIDGATFLARPVSVEQVRAFQDAVAAGHEERAVGSLMRGLFPWRLHYTWRVDRDPVKRFRALDRETQVAALTDFFGYLAGRNGSAPATVTTSGTVWNGPTEIPMMAPEPPVAG